MILEVKIKREHVKGSDTGQTNPQVEPITEETYPKDPGKQPWAAYRIF